MGRSVFATTREALIDFIRTHNLEDNKLPPEEELVHILGTSRGTIREALRALAREGVVTKRHGRGTFAHRRTLRARMRIDQIQDFTNLIEDGGYRPSIELQGETFGQRVADKSILEKLECGPGEEARQYDCLYRADGRPAIYCKIFIPEKNFVTLPPNRPEVSNVFDFVEKYCGREIVHTLVWFGAEKASPFVAHKLEIEPDTALLTWEELYCGLHDDLVGYSQIYFHPMMNICMLRKT
ncbi:MAG: GntR family transcriptional regulator [Thermoanaerobacteraceae bacterium]|nr:GntR family transcriptional regulator [Thermoanaerobacteraceae bacterium]